MPKRDRAVVTAAVGKPFAEMGLVTHPLMRTYADRCDADFIVFTEPRVGAETGLPGRYEKFQLFELLDRYDRVLFLDTDVLVSPVAPDLFEMVPRDTFAIANEETFERVPLDKQLTEQVLGPVSWRAPYFNSGVMLASTAHAELFDPRSPQLQAWDAFSRTEPRYHPAGEDQAYLNYRLCASAIPYVDLGHQFNFTWVRKDGHARFQSFFIHYAGPSGFRYGTRLDQIRRDAVVLGNPASFGLARSIPKLRWVLDRLDPDFLRYLFQRYVGRNRQA